MAVAKPNGPVGLAREYYRRLNVAAPDLAELFADDAEIYFPKFGIGRGKGALGQLGEAFGKRFAYLHHPFEDYRYTRDGDTVAVEGTTAGRDHSGREWQGGKTPGGRFCSIFECRDGLITRMSIYLDPDYLGDDASQFHWGKAGRDW